MASAESEQYGVSNGYLFEYVDKCTCGSPADASVNGMHEPGCGMEALGKVEDILDLSTVPPKDVLVALFRGLIYAGDQVSTEAREKAWAWLEERNPYEWMGN